MRAAISGSPTHTQEPTARVSIPLVLGSANQSPSRFTWSIVPHGSSWFVGDNGPRSTMPIAELGVDPAD
jgi:hypothetical protein